MNYEDQIKHTLQDMYEKGVKEGKRLGMNDLHVKLLELNHTHHGVNVMSHIEEIINELLTGGSDEPMTSEQYESAAKEDNLTSEQFPNV